MSERSILLVGGTGFLGRRIAVAFLHAGFRVSVLARGQHERLPEVEHLYADRREPAALEKALVSRSFDVVVDNIAYEPQDAASLLAVLDGRAGRYLLTSSTAVYSERFTRRPIREEAADLSVRVAVEAPNPFHSRLGHAYANGKRAVEQVVRQSGLAWTILRPPVILGADDRTRRVWWFVQRLLDGGPIVIPDWGPGRIFQVVWTDDVARAFVRAAQHPAAIGKTYNVAQAEIYTAESWISACAAMLGAQPHYVHVPEASLPDYHLDDYTLPIAGRPFGHMLLDVGAIRDDLSFEPRDESVWLAATLQGCAANPPSTDSAGYDRRGTETSVR